MEHSPLISAFSEREVKLPMDKRIPGLREAIRRYKTTSYNQQVKIFDKQFHICGMAAEHFNVSVD